MTEPQDDFSVEIDGLTRVFQGKKIAVSQLDLRVRKGEFFGFLGPNGAGKSTTIKILCGLLRPTRGVARVLGYDVVREPLEVKARIGLLPEEINTYERLTGHELLVFTGRMYGLSREESSKRADDLLDFMEISRADRAKLVLDYSMGMKKKTVLAAALIHGPKVLFLDEPFNGIDAVTSRAIRSVLTRAVQEGVTIFFSSHVMEVVEKLCTRIAVIHHGRLLAGGDLAELREQTGHGPDASLEEIFVSLVGEGEDRGDLSWIGG
ncbi:MAG: ABC transporter ATP-binding protein [Planctomycetota bacterium]